VTGVWLIALVGTAFALRVFMSWNAVLGQEYVSFVETDAWYHMRLIDAVVRDFPNRIWHDPYLLHPGGEAVNAGPMFDWLVASVALVLGGGRPSARLVDLIGAFVPPVLGALTLLPVYVLGRELWSVRAGLLAAALVAGMPGQLLLRSTLGFTDHHCLEVLLTAVTMMLVVMSLREQQTRRARRLLALLAGVGLGAYCLTWGGAVWLMVVLGFWVGTQALVEWLEGREPRELLELLALVAGVAGIVVLPWVRTRPQFAYQALAAGTVLVALGAAAATTAAAARFGWSRRLTALGAAVMVGIGGGIVLLAAPDPLSNLLADAARVSPFRTGGYVYEAQPLMASKLWRPVPLWREYAAAALLAPIAMGVLATEVWSRRGRGATLMMVWLAASLLATFGQIRFAHYLGLNVALVVGWLCDRALVLWPWRLAPVGRVAPVALAMALLVPGVPEIQSNIRRDSLLESGWHDALLWMSANTPPPFNRGDVYFRPGPPGMDRSSYGVLAWWDHGYWISRIARRVPVTNPRQSNVADAAAFMLASDEVTANAARHRLDAKFVIASWELQARSQYARTSGYFGGIVVAAGRDVRDYCGLYVREGTATGPEDADLYCYPSYFQTAAVRLYVYGGRAAMPPGPVTVLASRRELRAGVPMNVVTAEWSFPTHAEASGFMAVAGRRDLRIVSRNLHETCVPLEAFRSYVPVFRSMVREGGVASPPTVQVFEYRGDATIH
jgi:oligosaccharyl transferase (archaeosortase A-associated)